MMGVGCTFLGVRARMRVRVRVRRVGGALLKRTQHVVAYRAARALPKK